jgi:hypothetical protein
MAQPDRRLEYCWWSIKYNNEASDLIGNIHWEVSADYEIFELFERTMLFAIQSTRASEVTTVDDGYAIAWNLCFRNHQSIWSRYGSYTTVSSRAFREVMNMVIPLINTQRLSALIRVNLLFIKRIFLISYDRSNISLNIDVETSWSTAWNQQWDGEEDDQGELNFKKMSFDRGQLLRDAVHGLELTYQICRALSLHRWSIMSDQCDTVARWRRVCKLLAWCGSSPCGVGAHSSNSGSSVITRNYSSCARYAGSDPRICLSALA